VSNGLGKRQLLLLLQPANENLWLVLEEIAALPEPQRRRLLRPHTEIHFSSDYQDITDTESRRRLDVALHVLTLLEIGYETSVINEIDQTVDSIPQLKNLERLFESEAFLRYVNVYLYFGLRFLAWRIAAKTTSSDAQLKEPPFRDSNRQPFPLETPPPPEKDYLAADNAFEVLVKLCSDDPAMNPDDLSDQALALQFLDGFTIDSTAAAEDAPAESERIELWLRGLSPEVSPQDAKRFASISEGLKAWALSRRNFYLSLHGVKPESPVLATESGWSVSRPIGGWLVTNPLAARFAIADFYWISRLLRAEVAVNARVTYSASNWLSLLRFRAGLEGDGPEADATQKDLQKSEEVLRSVFDFVSDLVQNAVEITEEKEREVYEPELFSPHPEETAKWRKVFDQELSEIDRQRNRREFKNETINSSSPAAGAGGRSAVANPGIDKWMERIRKDKPIYNLIGICFSGGGIRSATFNLGVLQGLQELDLLRQIDFISTVSGGGFIGSWLVANVCRARHWLGRLTDWDDSIAHLRRYSNYLAPRLGIFSADTWTMWVSWARNALLIQLTALAWLWFLLLFARIGQFAFRDCANEATDVNAKLSYLMTCGKTLEFVVAIALMLPVLITLLYNLSGDRAISGNPTVEKRDVVRRKKRPWPGDAIWWAGILPSWCTSFLLASVLWAYAIPIGGGVGSRNVQKIHDYVIARRGMMSEWVLFIWLLLFFITFFTLSGLRHKRGIDRGRVLSLILRTWHALWISWLCSIILGFELLSIQYLFGQWSSDRDHFVWYAYIFGPPLVLAAHTFSVVLFIGFCGRYSKEAIREWWTRFGAGLAMFGVGYLAITIAAVFGPDWVLYLLSLGFVKWSAILSWVGTVIAGLFAGKSSKTNGNGTHSRSRSFEILAKVSGFVFILGAVLAASTSLYVVLAVSGAHNWNWRGYWETLPHIAPTVLVITLIILFVVGLLFSRFFEINIFGLNQFYRFRLVRCYLGATRWVPGFRKPQPFTNFDGNDDMRLSEVLGDLNKDTAFRGPFPIFNCALNLSGSSDLALHTRHSASFSLTPLFCGSDRRRVGYSPTEQFAGGVMLGQAVAISGAAASPNMGFNTSPLVAFLLTMFNVRLGWWFPNPGGRAWKKPGLSFSLYYLLRELFGVADERNYFVNVSDGGHFENLGVYELVRRRCKVIIVSDAECDEFLQFGSLGSVVRLCETDFGAKIDIDVSSIRQQKNGFSLAHCSVGRITYSNGSIGHLIYLKASMTGEEDVGIRQYQSVHPSFPHETTADQFFSESQFESYRKLGQHIVRQTLRGSQTGDHPVIIAERLADVLAPAGCSSEAFLEHTKRLDGIWERFRQTPELHPFFQELMSNTIGPSIPSLPKSQNQETVVGLELIQLMENVFLDLRLDDFWSHPDNRGWALLFMRWARSPRFRAIWDRTRRTFGIRFEYFCEARLGLPRDKPIVRV
jgi:hypothetical protein